MKLNERNIRNVVRRVINEMALPQNIDYANEYNEFLRSNTYWSYDGNNLLYDNDGLSLSIPCPLEYVVNGDDEPLDYFDYDTFVAQSWIDENLPSKFAFKKRNNETYGLRNYIEYFDDKVIGDLLTYYKPSNFITYLEDKAYEGEDE